jgi:hypothetical protein
MAYEGSKADEAEDARGAKKAGLSKKAFEKSAADKKADRVGVKAHTRKRRQPPPPPAPPSFGLAQAPGEADDMGGLEGGM